MSIKKHSIVAVLLLLSSAPAFASDSWHIGMDALYGRTSYDVSNCRGDCVVVPQNPSNDWHIGIGATIDKRFGPVVLGATARVYDGSNDDSFSRFLEALIRVSVPMGTVDPYIGIGSSHQQYSARLATRDGGDLNATLNSPLYVLGIQKRGEWGYWFVELAHTEDSVSATTTRSIGGVVTPASVNFDIERTTFFIGAAINFNR